MGKWKENLQRTKAVNKTVFTLYLSSLLAWLSMAEENKTMNECDEIKMALVFSVLGLMVLEEEGKKKSKKLNKKLLYRG